MPKLVYLCDWLPPDFGAVGQYSSLFARERAAAGDEVTLVGLSSTGDTLGEEAVGRGHLTTLRMYAPSYDRANFRARAQWTLRTNARLVWRARAALAAADEILFTGSPPFLLHFLAPAKLLLRKELTYRITDFHPECLLAEIAASTGRQAPAPLRLFHLLTLALRNQVDAFEVLGEDQRQRLLEIGIPAERITLKRDPSPVEIPPGTEPLPLPPALAGKVVLLYSGNFGVAHDHETFVAGYRRHHHEGSGRVALWLNATGAKADRVEELLSAEDLPVFRSRPVPLADLPRLLMAPAAHLITLRDEFVGFVLPSKVYGCLASGKPLLYVGSRRSDVHLLAQRSLAAECYFPCAVGDADAVFTALEALANTAAGHGIV